MSGVKLAIISSRSFNDKPYLFDLLDKKIDQIEMIISCGAKGADEIALQWAEDRGKTYMVFNAQLRDEYGNVDKGAVFKKNQKAIQAADRVLALWDGKSTGTKHSIDIANRLGKPIKVIEFIPVPELEDDHHKEELTKAWQEFGQDMHGTPSIIELFESGFYAGIKAASKKRRSRKSVGVEN